MGGIAMSSETQRNYLAEACARKLAVEKRHEITLDTSSH